MKTRTRAGLGGLVLALAASLLAGAAPASAQADDDGLRVVADAIYRVLPDDNAVEVEVSYVVTNLVPNQREGFRIIQTFFRSIVDVYPEAAVDLRAFRDDGTELELTPVQRSAEAAAELAFSPYTVWNIDLGPDLLYQQTRRFTVSYRLPDGEARSPEAWARVNPAYASFPVNARGDAGLSSVRVEFPPGYVVEAFGSEFERSDPFGATVLTAADIAAPLDFFAVMIGSSEIGLNSRPVAIDGVDAELVISSWPGDDEWDEFVERGLVDGIPFLVDEIGVDWPVEGELEVIETIAPALAGYGGWYYEPSGSDGTDAAIDVGEELLLDLLGHEIAHAWFNDDFTRMRWLNEGMAEYFGVRMARSLGAAAVEEFAPVTTSSAGAIDLINWGDPVFSDGIDPTEEFGYSASYQLIVEIAAEIGDEQLEATLGVLFAGQNPYRVALDDPGPARVDWRDLLDALELIGGSEGAQALLVGWVLDDEAEEDLEGRAEAREAVVALEAQAPRWSVPDVIPTLLADWDFDDVLDLTAEMTVLLDDAQELLDDAGSRSIGVPAGPRSDYEAVTGVSGGLDSTRSGLATQRAAIDRVLRAYDRAEAPTGFFENLGLYGTDIDGIVAAAHAAFESGDYEGAIELSADTENAIDDAESLGQQRFAAVVGAVVGLLLMILLLVLWLRRRQRVSADGDDGT